MNAYVYVGNNAVNRTDPEGLAAPLVFALPWVIPALEGLAGALIGAIAGVCIGDAISDRGKAYRECMKECEGWIGNMDRRDQSAPYFRCISNCMRRKGY